MSVTTKPSKINAMSGARKIVSIATSLGDNHDDDHGDNHSDDDGNDHNQETPPRLLQDDFV